MRQRRATGMALAATLALVACTAEPTPSPGPPCPTEAPTATSAQASLEGAGVATITVAGAVEGEIVIELYPDEAPISTANFVELVGCGFYDGIAFHRIINGFVIQAGDPATSDPDADPATIGFGGPDYRFPIETPAPDLDYEPYSVSMANDQESNGSQFFISLTDLSDGALERIYTIFGQITSGTETVDAIAAVPVDDPRVGRPLERVAITSIVISEAPAEESEE